jgi:hypothetical protein
VQSGNNATAEVLQTSRAEQKVEVIIEQHQGAERVALRCSTWVEGLGWCSQKTIHVESAELDDLHRAIASARQRLNRRRAETGQTVETAQVIQMPSLV